MATKLEEERWKEHLEKHRRLIYEGMKKGVVGGYTNKIIEDLRHIYCGGIPASILLLHGKLSNGFCFDRGSLITMAFEDDEYRVVHAEVNSLKLNPYYIDQYRAGKTDETYSIHCFAERTAKDGTVWVYDASVGLVFEKSVYYEIEKPKIITTLNKQQVKERLYYDFIQYSNLEEDKYVLPFIIPNIENYLVPIQEFYLEDLKNEVEILKKELEYDSLCTEVFEDMKSKGFLHNL